MCFPPLSGKKTPKIAFAAFHFCYVADDTQFPAVKKERREIRTLKKLFAFFHSIGRKPLSSLCVIFPPDHPQSRDMARH